jgi:hypothetical protein
VRPGVLQRERVHAHNAQRHRVGRGVGRRANELKQGVGHPEQRGGVGVCLGALLEEGEGTAQLVFASSIESNNSQNVYVQATKAS